jgi:hypothetical protein
VYLFPGKLAICGAAKTGVFTPVRNGISSFDFRPYFCYPGGGELLP